MFKYTPNKEVISKLESIQRSSTRKRVDGEYFYAVQITGSNANYFACGDFWKHYVQYEFYSKVRLQEVPLNGFLISAAWFTEEQI